MLLLAVRECIFLQTSGRHPRSHSTWSCVSKARWGRSPASGYPTYPMESVCTSKHLLGSFCRSWGYPLQLQEAPFIKYDSFPLISPLSQLRFSWLRSSPFKSSPSETGEMDRDHAYPHVPPPRTLEPAICNVRKPVLRVRTSKNG